MIRDHFFLLVLLAGILSTFLGLLFRDENRARLRLAARLFAALVGGAVAIGWLFAYVPRR